MDNKFIPVYLWIKSYRSIRNKGFHFTNEYTYTYDQDKNTLTRKKNNDYVSDFYGNSINISAIVGENGAGKTSLLSAVMSCFGFYGERDISFVLAFSNGEVWLNKRYFIWRFLFKDNNSITLENENKIGDYSLFDKRPPVQCFYYTQALDLYQYNCFARGIIDLSNSAIIAKTEAEGGTLGTYFMDNFYKQVEYLYSIEANQLLKEAMIQLMILN